MKEGIKFFYLHDNEEIVAPIDEKDSGYYHMLTYYIAGNIMGWKDTCEELLQDIKKVEEGEMEERDLSGNHCYGWMTKESVEIGMSVGKGKIQETIYPFWIFKQAIEEWYDFLQNGREREIEFDYEPQEHEKTRYSEGVI